MSADMSDDRSDQVPDWEQQSGGGGVAARAGQATGRVATTTKEEIREVAAEAQHQVRDLASEARVQARLQASTQQRQLAGRLRSVGDELSTMADKGEGSGLATEITREVSGRVHNWAGWLETREPADVLDEIREFARRRPGLFLLGAALAGVAAGRLTRGLAEANGGGTSSGRMASPTVPASGDTVPDAGAGPLREEP